MRMAREHWPEQLNALPMIDVHKTVLKTHWETLPQDFRITGAWI